MARTRFLDMELRRLWSRWPSWWRDRGGTDAWDALRAAYEGKRDAPRVVVAIGLIRLTDDPSDCGGTVLIERRHVDYHFWWFDGRRTHTADGELSSRPFEEVIYALTVEAASLLEMRLDDVDPFPT